MEAKIISDSRPYRGRVGTPIMTEIMIDRTMVITIQVYLLLY